MGPGVGPNSVTKRKNHCPSLESNPGRPFCDQPQIQWVPGVLSVGVKLTTHFHIVPWSRVHGSIPPLPIRLHGVVLN
jgi:hypothetical protein